MKEDTPSNEETKIPDEPVKILLAEDDKDDQELFQEALDKSEIPSELTVVDNGKELIDTLKDPNEPNPDIIFIDINMPEKNGKEALAEIKADDTLKEIPAIILSTSKNEKDINETYEAGANLYVHKPSTFESFILLLKKVFSLKWAGALLKPIKKRFVLSEKNLRE